jgi:hypothetical protein
LSTSALRICLICTDGSVYLVTSSRNTPHHTISQPDKTLQSIHNLSQLIYHKTGKIRNLRLSRQRLRSLVCYDVTPCSLAEMLPHPKAYSSIVKPAAYSTYRLVSVDTQRLSIYVFNPLNTKRDEKGLGDAARGPGGGGKSQAQTLQFYPLLPIPNCPLPIKLPSSLPSKLFQTDLYKKDERARTGTFTALKTKISLN